MYLLQNGTIGSADEKIRELLAERDDYLSALFVISAPKRSDGTFNRCREACQQIAEKVIKKYEK